MHHKVWGAELWLINEDLYCCKLLYLDPGYQCSLHKHHIKDETFKVLSGFVTLEFGESKRDLLPGDRQRISPGTFHRFANHHDTQTAVILEVSTHHDDQDVERLEESRKI